MPAKELKKGDIVLKWAFNQVDIRLQFTMLVLVWLQESVDFSERCEFPTYSILICSSDEVKIPSLKLSYKKATAEDVRPRVWLQPIALGYSHDKNL